MKDTSKKWFKSKRYGYGWTPCSSEGWLVLLLYVWANIILFLAVDSASHSSSDTLIAFAPAFLAMTVLLCTICVWKGEKAHWRWGGR